MKKKILALVAIALLLSACLPGTGMARSVSSSARGEQIAAENKDETVYATLDAGGGVRGLYVVNHFDGVGDKIIDWGDYESIANLSGEEKALVRDGKITWAKTPGKDFYYKGLLKTGELPFNFSFAYKLDGKDIEPQRLAGATGKIAIDLKVEPNPKAPNYFRENYALQIQLPFDSTRCKNFSAPGASMALAGKTLAVAYTLLPSQAAAYTLSCDAVDFRMAAGIISITRSAMPSSADMEEMRDGVGALKGGLYELRDGSQAMRNDMRSLLANLRKLRDGGQKLGSEAGALQTAAGEISGALSSLRSKSAELAAGAEQVGAGIRVLARDAAQARAQHERCKDGLASLSNSFEALQGVDLLKTKQGLREGDPESVAIAAAVLDALAGAPETIDSLSKELRAMDDFVVRLDGIDALAARYNELYNGVAALPEGIDEIQSGFQAYQDGAVSYYEGVERLTGGIQKMLTALEGSPAEIQKMADGIDVMTEGIDGASRALSGLSGGQDNSGPVVSFVSPGKMTVRSVQFVVYTAEIAPPAEEKTVAPSAAAPTFWERLIDLFTAKKTASGAASSRLLIVL